MTTYSISSRVDNVTSIPVFVRSPIAPAPQSCKIEITSFCPYKCTFCTKSTNPTPDGEMDRALYSRLLREMHDFGVQELATMAVGLVVGTIGNVQASVCLVLQQFFDAAGRLEAATQAAWTHPEQVDQGPLAEQVDQALARQPPVAFLPRRVTRDVDLGEHELKAGDDVILWLRAAGESVKAEYFLLSAVQAQVDADVQAAASYAQDIQSTTTMIMIALVLVAVIAAVLTGMAIARQINRPLKKAVSLAEAVAAGDLTASVEHVSRDELGLLVTSLNKMRENLAGMIGVVRDSADNLASAADEISATAHELSLGAETQSTATEETSASIEQMAASIDQVAVNAEQLGAAAEETSATMDASQRMLKSFSRPPALPCTHSST